MCFLGRKTKNPLDSFMTVDQINKKTVTDALSIRGIFKICIIDDDRKSLDELKKLGFDKIELHKKARKLEDYKDYPVILCDISGVATEYSNDEEGLAFAKQLKKMYPCAEVYLFTAQNVSNYGEPEGLPIIHKPQTNTSLASYLDKSIKNLLDPSYVWAELYKYLIKNNVKPKEIVEIEDKFAKMYNGGGAFNIVPVDNNDVKNALENVASFLGTLTGAFVKEYVHP